LRGPRLFFLSHWCPGGGGGKGTNGHLASFAERGDVADDPDLESYGGLPRHIKPHLADLIGRALHKYPTQKAAGMRQTKRGWE
jgi:hypothetical protein